MDSFWSFTYLVQLLQFSTDIMDVLQSAKKMKGALFLTVISRLENVSGSFSAADDSGDFFFH